MPEVDKETEKDRKLFIGGLHPNATEDDLKEVYGQWGTLIDCVVIRDPYTSRSKKFGFVTYTEPDQLEAAMSNRPHMVAGKEVEPKRAVPRELQNSQEIVADPSEGKRLFVSGIREDHTEEMLKEHFKEFGTVEKTEIICDQCQHTKSFTHISLKITGQKRGFAFVTFEESAPVDHCIEVRSHMVMGHRCDVKRAKSREELRFEEQKRDRRGREIRSRGRMNGGQLSGAQWNQPVWSPGRSWNDPGYNQAYGSDGYGQYQSGYGGVPAWNQPGSGWSPQGTWQSGPQADGYYGNGGSQQWTQTPEGNQF